MSSILSSAVDSAVLSLHFRASEQLRRVEEALRLPKGNNAKKLRAVASELLVELTVHGREERIFSMDFIGWDCTPGIPVDGFFAAQLQKFLEATAKTLVDTKCLCYIEQEDPNCNGRVQVIANTDAEMEYFGLHVLFNCKPIAEQSRTELVSTLHSLRELLSMYSRLTEKFTRSLKYHGLYTTSFELEEAQLRQATLEAERDARFFQHLDKFLDARN